MPSTLPCNMPPCSPLRLLPRFARCRDAREAGKKPLSMTLTTKLDSWKRIGNYALTFAWGDSHSEGIFAYDALRTFCPCGACDKELPS